MSKDYWEKRSLETMKKIYNAQEKKNKIFIESYNKVLKEIENDLTELYKHMDSNNISLSEAYKYNRLNKIKKQIEDRIVKLAKEETKFNKESLTNNYKEAAKMVSDNLGIEFDKISKEVIEEAIQYPWSGHMFSEIIWKNVREQLVYNIQNIIVSGLAKGESYINMAKKLQKEMDKGIYNALRVIRTETANIVNNATLDRYKSKGVKKIKIITAPDERRCETCGKFHDKVYEIDKAPHLPNHAQCRCCYAPVIDMD
ncbi:minor capsid protein [Clostridium perfringens]|uniref:minor capsid protein n=1 Tax=Clostridium perfringens TaxID=1502 RepID=UPI0018E4BE73|nr:minor capsid protein [Clostridium perfringens]EIW6613665.1 minor capsid protein [Clostridium perfringens]MBI6019840.1 minor capsid protein [Clostridium perfringens]